MCVHCTTIVEKLRILFLSDLEEIRKPNLYSYLFNYKPQNKKILINHYYYYVLYIYIYKINNNSNNYH